MRHFFLLPAALSIFFFLHSCSIKKTEEESNQKLFTLLSPESTGVFFINKLVDSREVNYTFEYRFNGSGVGIGDINNDGLPDLFFAANDLDRKLYLNKGNMKFEDISAQAGILPRQSISTGVNMIDINADGWLDIHVCRTGKFRPDDLRANQLYINNGNLTFTERAKEYGLDDISFSNQSAFFDYDLDGDLDMFLVNNPLDFTEASIIKLYPDTQRMYVSNRLYRNNGNNTFTDVTFKAGVDNKAYGFNPIILDINTDGLPDIFVTNDFVMPDFLYINNGDGTFTESLTKYFKHVSNSSMGAYASDFNNDGLMDITVVDMMAEDNRRQKLLKGPMNYDDYNLAVRHGYYHQNMRNMLHMNNGNGSFSEIGSLAGISQTDWSWTPLMADFDHDGWNDLYISNGYRRDLTDMDYALFLLDSLNKIGGVQQFKNIFEILNMLPATPLKNYFFKNNGDLTFSDVSGQWSDLVPGFSNGAACADLDLDGDLDIVVNNIDGYASIFRSNASDIKENHYIRFKLKGEGKNLQGIGACIEITTQAGKQIQCYNQAQGYLSSTENILHFGIGKQNTVGRAEIRWAKGKIQVLENISADQVLVVEEKNANEPAGKPETASSFYFEDITPSAGIKFEHRENDYVDFKREPLLMQKYSMSSPCIAKGDVNNDSMEDFFIGNATGSSSTLFIQQANGTFKNSQRELWEREKNFENTAALFFDADADKDNDLIVCGGGSEWDENSSNYLVRLYLNDGKGNFSYTSSSLPEIHTSCNTVAASDFDKDGDEDLFIGGRIIPGNYPVSPRSYILKNNPEASGEKFTDATGEICTALKNPGLVTSALWTDFNNDSQTDLIITGQWMKIMLFKNENGKLTEATTGSGLDSSEGWWNCISQNDFDNDGDMDYVAGNLGLNSRIKAAQGEPVIVYANDFDKNGTTDAVMCMYYQGVSYPIHRREQLLDQVRPLRKKFTRYAPYSMATINDIFSREQVDSSLTLYARTFATCYIENLGNGKFRMKQLHNLAQTAPVNSILCSDYDGDGKTDMLMAGNCYAFEPETGRCDAFTGLLMKGDGKGNFTPVISRESGFYNQSDARVMIELKVKNDNWIVVGNNDEKVRVFRKLKGEIQ